MKTIKKMYNSVFVFLCFLIFVFSCKPKDIPVLTTTEVSNLSSNSAVTGGTIISDGGGNITASGICWSLKENPTIADFKTNDGSGNGTFTSNITGINSTKVYYVRAYATNSAGTGYGNTVVSIIADADGNIYHKVVIGTQSWLVENLRTTKYRSGESVSTVTDATAWSYATFGACCDYNIDAAYGSIYGKLYNFAAINDSRNIAPNGWHIATDTEWTLLINYTGGEINAAKKLKEIGLTHWKTNSEATSEYGFNALPGGIRIPNGDFGNITEKGSWWSSSENNSTTVWYFDMNYDNNGVNRILVLKGMVGQYAV